MLKNLGGLRSDGNIQPIPAIKISKLTIDDKDIAVVEVLPSHFPPVRYDGKVWIRIGPRKATASEQEERILIEKRNSHVRSFDMAPAGAPVEDLSKPLFIAYRQQVIDPEIIEANHRSLEQQLASLRFFDTKNNCLTNAGVLVFGKNPRFYIPGAYIQFIRYDGATMNDPVIDQAEIDGDLLSVLRELDVRIRANLQNTLHKNSVLQESVTPNYPERAIREFLMNAAMHRDYQSNAPIRFYWFSNRIEIHNPGGLYGMVKKETLGTIGDYRNPAIAEVMKGLGYVNRFGYGIQKAQSSLKENGNPPAVLDPQSDNFLVIMHKA